MQLRTKQHNQQITERAKSANYEKAMDICHSRLTFVIICLTLSFLALISRLFYLTGFSSIEDIKITSSRKPSKEFLLKRASITDRNGELLATNITTASLYANPRYLINPDEAARKLSEALPSLKYQDLITKFKLNKNFAWVKRHLTPKEQQIIHDLGIPGLYFTKDERRVYPQTHLFAHSVGFTDVDGNGLSGIEKTFNYDLAESTQLPLELSLDLRIQNIVREELLRAIDLNQAIGASGLVMNVNNGEVISMVSLPDFNPNRTEGTNDRQRFNQISLGSYEMGSVFKVLTTASAFDLGRVKVNDAFNVSVPYKVANFKINDYKGKGGELSIPEILMYSSNIGTAQIASYIGVKDQQEYMQRFGVLDKLSIEIPEVSSPRYPPKKKWNEVSMVTISYGHGIAVTPLHLARAIAASVNGGVLVQPTLLKHHAPRDEYPRVIGEETSLLMRKMLRLVVTGGSGRRAEVPGYFLGGKSGTAEKICGRGYCKNSNLSLFVAAYPIHKPEYLVLVMVDEAKRNTYNNGMLSGGAVSAPVAGEIVKRISPILGVHPILDKSEEINDILSLDFSPRHQKISAR
ncbi:Peptidoglycan synthetase FtsI [Candidatus Jidaibacter acanthamoeba]|uniref:Peptidoglycan synthetase FtsI n=1 Tax=Candidatus Jidaibacter acanthamoebae TaxID=86105 RepID=A0A0C1QF40_9RICK|nr:penicillin-binding protein 2 [Candidatus Jidaibacter acanthamoeba]KIE04159.1 Peptidoglycan synthetase FtsI [Candidatus Jidaibacter acanthamoeba]